MINVAQAKKVVECATDPKAFFKELSIKDFDSGEYFPMDLNINRVRVLERMNDSQFQVFNKNRQDGLTRAVHSEILRKCMFNKNYTVGMAIFDKCAAAQEDLRVLRAMYDTLPEYLKVPMMGFQPKQGAIEFENGSRIVAAGITSLPSSLMFRNTGKSIVSNCVDLLYVESYSEKLSHKFLVRYALDKLRPIDLKHTKIYGMQVHG